MKIETKILITKLKKLPAILAGTSTEDSLHLQGTFRAAFIHRLMEQVHEAFEIKSLGGTDDLGEVFAPLSKKRANYKNSPKFKSRFPQAISHAIVRVTSKLLDSYAAGFLSGEIYTPPKDQAVELKNNLIKIYSRLDYAVPQSNMRPFWSDDISPWIDEAIEAGLNAVVAKVKEIV